MHTRPAERFISSGAKNSLNNCLRAPGSRRFSVKHVASVNAPPKPRTSWYCSLGLMVMADFPGLAFDHARGFCFSCFWLAVVVQTEIAPAGESVASAWSVSGMLAATAPAAEIFRNSRRRISPTGLLLHLLAR